MDDLDRALIKAWNRLEPTLRGDRVEALRRGLRRSAPTLSRPVRPWCLCLRASDRRIPDQALILAPHNADVAIEPHTVTLDAESIRKLCAPVALRWPGIPWTSAARMLGRHEEALRPWIKKGVFQTYTRPARTLDKRGPPIPMVWSPHLLDPNADKVAPPDPAWGTLWQYIHNDIPEDFTCELRREPYYKKYPNRPSRDERGHFRGWRFICPGLAHSSPRAPGSTPCNRSVERLYYPLRPDTILEAFGIEDLADINIPFPNQTNPTPNLASTTTDSEPNPPRQNFACQHCHNINYISLANRYGWNTFIAHITAGLLYGHEVPRPSEFERKPTRTSKPSTRPGAREREARKPQLIALLAEGLTYKQIAARQGITLPTAADNIRLLYKEHNVKRRHQLLNKLNLDKPTTKRQTG